MSWTKLISMRAYNSMANTAGGLFVDRMALTRRMSRMRYSMTGCSVWLQKNHGK
ncbi:hypothetical protein [Secundilactobacillus silagei]|uniref:hypothetical protein n=1 Tax=Secundilactobacillus silagei TaxID=1293415 RepID=UPI0020923E53|nr:hypothetical protein [Secundilactobacillus silagei]